MKHVDIIIHVLCLLSGIVTFLLGFLLYLKYRLKVIRDYAFFILTTTLTVAATTAFSYVTYFASVETGELSKLVGVVIFEALLALITYSFAAFALGVLARPLKGVLKAFVILPWGLIVLNVAAAVFFSIRRGAVVYPQATDVFFTAVLVVLFLTFVGYSVAIFLNLKYMDNYNFRRALKTLAVLFIVDIPVQSLIIAFDQRMVVIMMTRNIFYFLVNTISVVFAAKYFFMEAPAVKGRIEAGERFVERYGITPREKEVIDLLIGGLSIKEIGGKLDRSFKTVNNHIYNIYQKAGVSSKMELLNLILEDRV